MTIRRAVFAGAAFLLPLCARAAEGAAGEEQITHRMLILVLQLGVLLVATRAGNLLFERIRLPGVLGELAAGMLIGPFLLGSVGLPGFAEGLFPLHGSFPVSAELYGFCAVASVVLLFMVGLETDLSLFFRFSVAGSAVGVGGVIASFLVGDLIGVVFSRSVFGAPLGFMSPACLFLGVISTATSVGITARILSERKATDSPEGVTILAGAVIDDVLGIIMLTIVLGIAGASTSGTGINWGHVGLVALKATGIWLGTTAVALLSARKLSSVLKRTGEHRYVAVMALGLALILAGLFEKAGLAMIIGAYVLGLALSKADIANMVRENLEPVYSLLVPLFFGVMGMMVDFRALGDTRVLAFGLVYSATAVGAKFLGAGLPSLLFGFNGRGAARIGAGMVPRGEVALIVAGVGLAAGALQPKVFGVAILMTTLTTVLAPPLLVLLFRSKARGTRKEIGNAAGAEIPFTFPSSASADWVVGRLMERLEEEDFFVHVLDHERGLVQVRKDETVFSFHREEREIRFSCSPVDLALVKTALFIVAGELRAAMEGLQRPFDPGSLGLGIEEATPGEKKPSVAASVLRQDRMIPALQASDKEGIIRELLGVAVATGAVDDGDVALHDLLERERHMSTGLQHGVAIPHARTAGVHGFAAVIGLKPEGVAFDALDGEPSRVFVLTLCPTEGHAPQIQFMAEISRMLVPESCAALLQSRTPADMARVLAGEKPAVRPPAPRPAHRVREAGFDARVYIRPEFVIPRLQGTTKDEVITEMINRLDGKGVFTDKPAVLDAVRQRERLMSTGLEDGIAVPHCRSKDVSKTACVIGMKPSGLDFESADGKPTRIVVLTAAPDSAEVPVVQLMASLVQAFQGIGTESLLGIEDPEEAAGVITAALPGVRDL